VRCVNKYLVAVVISMIPLLFRDGLLEEMTITFFVVVVVVVVFLKQTDLSFYGYGVWKTCDG